MKVLVLTADYPPIRGGIATVARNLAHEMVCIGHEVTVVAPWFPGQAQADQADSATVRRFRGYWLRWLRIIPMALTALPLLKKADLVLAVNVSHGGLIARLAKPFTGKPYVAFAYAYEFLRFRRNSAAGGLLRWVYRGAERVIAISHFTRDNLVAFGIAEDRVALVLPGAPEPRVLPQQQLEEIKRKYAVDTDHLILAVGRFVPRKGHRTLVRAMPHILEHYPDALAILAGEGPTLALAVREANDLGVRDHVLFPGHIADEDMAGLYQLCELFALPTGRDRNGQVEGFGLVFCEANAYGKPVVAGRSGGVSDAVADGETGILVESGNPRALADAIVSLMSNPEWAADMGAKGRKRVEQELNWRQFTEKTLAAAGYGETQHE